MLVTNSSDTTGLNLATFIQWLHLNTHPGTPVVKNLIQKGLLQVRLRVGVYRKLFFVFVFVVLVKHAWNTFPSCATMGSRSTSFPTAPPWHRMLGLGPSVCPSADWVWSRWSTRHMCLEVRCQPLTQVWVAVLHLNERPVSHRFSESCYWPYLFTARKIRSMFGAHR